jgi:hypothetical protein
LVAALPRCAVSQVCNLQTAREVRSLADYKSAIQQIANLRYAASTYADFVTSLGTSIWTNSRRNSRVCRESTDLVSR